MGLVNRIIIKEQRMSSVRSKFLFIAILSSFSIMFFDSMKPQSIALNYYTRGNRYESPDSASQLQFRPGSLWDGNDNNAPMQLDNLLWKEHGKAQKPEIKTRSNPSAVLMSKPKPQDGPSTPDMNSDVEPGEILNSNPDAIMSKSNSHGDSSTINMFSYYPWDSRVMDANSRNSKSTNGGEQQAPENSNPIYDYLHYNPLNILTLGGSIAWGGYIANRYDAFPFLISDLHPESRVDNLAIRATGAAYPAACIQSLLEGDGAFPEYQIAPGIDTADRPKGIYYDIILLEFSVNGETSTDSLIARLNRRFPDALLVYVHLESITHPPEQHLNSEYFAKLMAPANGIFYIFPKEEAFARIMEGKKDIMGGVDEIRKQGNKIPDYLELFADDKHHLSEIGHKVVANEVMDLLLSALMENPERIRPQRPRLGTWGLGDQCYLWLSSWGYFPASVNVIGGGGFTMFDEAKKKYSYEINYGINTTFTFERKIFGGRRIPLHLVYMTLGDPPLYPKAIAEINYGGDGDSGVSSNHVLDPRTDEAFPQWSWAHLTRPEIIGESKPGINRITITPTEESPNPFRLVGIIVCGACEDGNGASSIRMRVPD